MRRLAVLIRHLPADAATARALDVRTEWSTTDYLLAACLDTLASANWLTVELNKRKGAANPYPAPTPRPGDREQQHHAPAFVGGRELAEWLRKVG